MAGFYQLDPGGIILNPLPKHMYAFILFNFFGIFNEFMESLLYITEYDISIEIGEE